MKIENEFLSCTINEIGAQITSIFDKRYHKSLLLNNTDVWYGHSPNLFPFIGKSWNNQYTFENKTYTMKPHGFVKDASFSLESLSSSAATLSFESNPYTRDMYPFDFKISYSYTLIGLEVIITAVIVNNSKVSMPYMLGHHPAFLVSKDDILEVNSNKDINSYDNYEGHITTSNNWDNRTINVDEKSVLNTIILDNITSIRLRDKEGNSKIDLKSSDFKYFGIWAKQTVEEYRFICLEPWSGLPSSFGGNENLHDQIGIEYLDPNMSVTYSYTIKVY